MELLEKLRNRLSCLYISDLRYEPYKLLAKQELQTLNLQEYTLRELTDAAQYLYEANTRFESYEEAAHFFCAGLTPLPSFL